MNKFLKNKSDIITWLDSYNIKNYDLIVDHKYGYVVDIDDDVDLFNKKLDFIPIKFNIIYGKLNCSYNNLSSLIFCPKTVGGSFRCSGNQLSSLQFCPSIINGDFDCDYNNLTSLEFCPTTIDGHFDCSINNLTNLIHFPNHIGGVISLKNNKLIKIDKEKDKNNGYNFKNVYKMHLEHKILYEQTILEQQINKTHKRNSIKIKI